jgi:hypothetical protein
MATVRSTNSTPAREATHRVMVEDIDRINAGSKSSFPDYASFVASDLVTEAMIEEAHACGHAVVIVDEHERVTVLPAPDPSVGERESERFWRDLLTHW